MVGLEWRLTMKHLLTVEDIPQDSFMALFAKAAELKANRRKPGGKRPLEGKTIAMIFAKSSTRTRVSFEVGIYELGGHPMYMNENQMQAGRGETPADTAKVLSRYVDGIVIRTFEHSIVEELARNSSVPVINALTNEYHPCQALTDIFTVLEYSGKLEGVKIVFLGDGCSNMANSLMLAGKLCGLDVIISSPKGFEPDAEIMARAKGNGQVNWEPDPIKAVKDADYIYTDVWVSMGFEDEATERLKIFTPYQVNAALMKAAKPNAKVLHCLPAHRGEEITDEVMDSPASIVFDQAENRLHVQKAIMTYLFEGL